MSDSQAPLRAIRTDAWLQPDADDRATRRAVSERTMTALATERLRAYWNQLPLPSLRRDHVSPPREEAASSTPATVPSVGSGYPFLTAPDGCKLLAGLHWEIAPSTEYLRISQANHMIVRQHGRRATIAVAPAVAASQKPVGSLLLSLANSLQQTVVTCEGPWAFIAEVPNADGRPLVWLAIADIEKPFNSEATAKVVPRPGTEQIFDTADECLAALQAHLEIVEIAGLAVRWLPTRPAMDAADTHRGPMITGFSHVARNIPLHDVPLASTSDGQRFATPWQISPRLAGGVGLLAAASMVVAVVLVPLAQAYFTPAPPPPIDYVTVMPERGGFAANCEVSLASWWPRIIGWEVVTSGCALPTHLPSRLAFMHNAPVTPIGTDGVAARGAGDPRPTQPMMIWQEFVPTPGRNQVMAVAAANQVIARWDHQVELNTQDRGRLTLWRQADIPLTKATAGESGDPTDPSDPAMASLPDGSLDWQNLRAQLATLWLDTPNAVLLKNEQFIITSDTRPTTALERAGLIGALAPVRIEHPGELILEPIATRTLPATMFTELETNG
ncbi:MAG: hypothetical protein OXC63_08405 [Aestuariivita sp.]|nr:hypothetical protein [Aestuariivita sp.]MCY4345413.1 hypothetical protein [Aestuariivita sp.]